MTASSSRSPIEPIRATRTFEAAIEHLTEAIERARLRRGDRLPSESELAVALGISKPTLRQALRVLELSGLVTVRRGKGGGIVVASDLVPAVALSTAVAVEESAVIDALRARRVLERAVALEALERATDADLAELERTIDLLERHLGERSSVMRADAMFHRAMVRACHNATIQAAMHVLARRWRRSATPTRAASNATATRSTCTGASSTRCDGVTATISSGCWTSTCACSRTPSRRRSAAAGRPVRAARRGPASRAGEQARVRRWSAGSP